MHQLQSALLQSKYLLLSKNSKKFKPYQNKKTQFKSKKNISEIIHHLDKKIKKEENSRIVCQNKIKTIRDSFNLINESSKFLQQFVYN